jgi:ADP-heptose:LPS heptosyltransferase
VASPFVGGSIFNVAVALGRPTVGIYCATEPQLTGLHGGEQAVNLGGPGAPPTAKDVAQALGCGDVFIGEVSTVNDDLTDNVFAEPIGRFATIDEDVAPLHLLVADYDKFLGSA